MVCCMRVAQDVRTGGRAANRCVDSIAQDFNPYLVLMDK